ncbi:MAG: hypothetical protein PHI70_09400 [Proteiniphilum sp.]|nr:hypothetical protein [Proteiniphilum sp.]
MPILPRERRAVSKQSSPLAMMETASTQSTSGYGRLRTPSSSDTTMMKINTYHPPSRSSFVLDRESL